MYARIVTVPLKPGCSSKFRDAIEKGVIPLIRTRKGFLDEIALVTPDGKFGVGMSFWDSKENADAFNRSGYGEVMKALDPVSAGPPELKVYDVTNSTAHKLAAAIAA